MFPLVNLNRCFCSFGSMRVCGSLNMHWDSFVSVCITVMPQSGLSDGMVQDVCSYSGKISLFVC